jgi:hypothetical protein
LKPLALTIVLALGGCYSPSPQDRGFKCDPSQGSICPEGLYCDPVLGLCVAQLVNHDMGLGDLHRSFDLNIAPGPRSCDDRVAAGAFSGVTNLGDANSPGDETSISVTSDGTRIYFMSDSTLMTAALTSAKAAGAASPVTITGGPAIVQGGAVAKDGTFWFAGSDTASGPNTNTQLYTGHFVDPTHLTVDGAHLPQGKCPFTDPALLDGDPAKELYVSYPLAGCTEPVGPYIAQGLVDKQIGAFIGALAAPGFRAPSLLPGGLTMLFSSVGAGARLSYAQRPSQDALWTGPTTLPGLGASVRDVQAVVSADCSVLWVVSERAGGHGGLDLWAADIAPQ